MFRPRLLHPGSPQPGAEIIRPDGLEPQPSQTDPYEFVVAHQAKLGKSTELWKKVAGRADEIRTENMAVFTDVITEFHAASGTVAQPGRVEREADKLSAGFSTYAVLLARFLSADPSSTNITYKIMNEVGQVMPVAKAFRDGPVPKRLGMGAVFMWNDIREADSISKNVLGDLTDKYSGRPEGFIELAQAYQSGSGTDPSFAELKEMITVDWAHPDRSKSVIRAYLKALAEDRDLHIEGFGHHVATTETGEAIGIIRDMARFAGHVSGERNVSIEEVMVSTSDRWDEFDIIAPTFRSFVEKRMGEIEDAVATIVNPINRSSIRMPRSQAELEQFKEGFRMNFQDNRSTRRRAGKRGAIGTIAMANLPDAREISQAAGSLEKDKEPAKLMQVKKMSQGPSRLVEIEAGDVAKAFSIKATSGQISEDIERVIARLVEEPISSASEMLKANSLTVALDSGRLVKVPLRRFAPDKSHKLTRRGNSSPRIIYAIIDGMVVLYDVLPTHEAYNKKYK
jgi:hypothetical protein